MILSVEERRELNEIIDKIIADNKDIEWISEDECVQYRNTEYESIIIGFGKGDRTSHYKKDIGFDTELTHFYQKQLTHFLTIFKVGNNLKVQVYKTNNGLNGSTKIDTFII